MFDDKKEVCQWKQVVMELAKLYFVSLRDVNVANIFMSVDEELFRKSYNSDKHSVLQQTKNPKQNFSILQKKKVLKHFGVKEIR